MYKLCRPIQFHIHTRLHLNSVFWTPPQPRTEVDYYNVPFKHISTLAANVLILIKEPISMIIRLEYAMNALYG